MGKALLMVKSDDEIALLVRRINAEMSGGCKPVSSKHLLADLHESRGRGYAISNGEVVAGTGVLAVAFSPIPHQPRMAFGLGSTIDILAARREDMAQ